MTLLIINWKMYKDKTEAESFIRNIISSNCELIIAPHSLLLASIISNFNLAAQNVSTMDMEGAYTGEISAYLLKKNNINYAIIGHSERVKYFNETSEDIKQKLTLCFKHSIIPILCIGEEKQDLNEAKKIIISKLNFFFKDLSIKELIIAYEPIWAVNKQVQMEADYIEEIIQTIWQYFKSINIEKSIKVVYGGSVNLENINSFANIKELAGFMLGRISLDVNNLNNLIKKIC